MSANKVESLATWYLRFNGYFTVPNFTVHPDVKKGKEAEADVLAVRFPYSSEEPGDYCFERDIKLRLPDLKDAPGATNMTDFLIVEAKARRCELNRTWVEPGRRNVQYALHWMGFESDPEQIEKLAASIYESGMGKRNRYLVRLVSIGGEKSDDLQEKYPDLVQIELFDAVRFVRDRLTTGCARLNRQHWNVYIQEFARRAEARQNVDSLLAWTLTEGKED